MKADIEKVLKEIGNDRHGLGDLIVHYGNPEEIEMQEWWDAPINVLQDNLRRNVQQRDKKTLSVWLLELEQSMQMKVKYQSTKIKYYFCCPNFLTIMGQ